MSKQLILTASLFLSIISHSSHAFPITHRVLDRDKRPWAGHAAVVSATERLHFINDREQDVGKSYDFVAYPVGVFFKAKIDDSKPVDVSPTYSIEFIQMESDNKQYTKKSCIFIITTKEGSDTPDIHVTNYNGANCSGSGQHNAALVIVK